MIPFRHCIREPHGSAVKFEILAAAPNEFQVRYPDYDYIKMGVGPSVMYNREQLLCFLLTYDKAECESGKFKTAESNSSVSEGSVT